MFWKKSKNELPGPESVPNSVGREIVVALGGVPDEIWYLKAVRRPKEGEKDTFDVRVYSAAQAASKKVVVKDYNSLSEHPELILYGGWFNKTGAAKMEKRH